MSLIAKYILKNIFENKARSVLVLLSIAVSAALFFATMGMNNTCKQMYVLQAVREGGNSDIKVSVNDKVGDKGFISDYALDFVADRLDYIVSLINVEGLYNPTDVNSSQYLDIVGIDLEDLDLYNSYSLVEEGNIQDFTGPKAIISSVFADKINASVGSNISVKIGEKTVELSVEGIAEQTGFFLNESNGYVMVIPRDYLAGLLDFSF